MGNLLINPNIRFTYEDYKSLPESLDKRYELLDGNLYMVPAPSTLHQIIVANFGFILQDHVRKHRLGIVLYAPIDVVFGEGEQREIVQPDLIYVSNERMDIIADDEIQGAPDLVVEVTSKATERRDRGYKKTLYGRYGVQEYWIVDPNLCLVEIYRQVEDDFIRAQVLNKGETLNSQVLPELSIDLEKVFGR